METVNHPPVQDVDDTQLIDPSQQAGQFDDLVQAGDPQQMLDRTNEIADGWQSLASDSSESTQVGEPGIIGRELFDDYVPPDGIGYYGSTAAHAVAGGHAARYGRPLSWGSDDAPRDTPKGQMDSMEGPNADDDKRRTEQSRTADATESDPGREPQSSVVPEKVLHSAPEKPKPDTSPEPEQGKARVAAGNEQSKEQKSGKDEDTGEQRITTEKKPEEPKIDEKAEELLKKIGTKVQGVDITSQRNSEARDYAATRQQERATEGGFMRRMWNKVVFNNMLHGSMRQRDIRIGKERIDEEGNGMTLSGASKDQDNANRDAVADRFVKEGEDQLVQLHRDRGETNSTLKLTDYSHLSSEPPRGPNGVRQRDLSGNPIPSPREQAEANDPAHVLANGIRADIQDYVHNRQGKAIGYDHATDSPIYDGKPMTLDEFRAQIDSRWKSYGATVSPNEVEVGKLYANNMADIAVNARAAADHGIGIKRIDEALKLDEINVGVAAMGVRGEANYTGTDRAVEWMAKTKGLGWMNESTLGIIAGAGTVAYKIATQKGLREGTAIAAAGIATGGVGFAVAGGAALIAGGIGYVRERHRMTNDRVMRSREHAKTGVATPESSEAAADDDKSRWQAARAERKRPVTEKIDETLYTTASAADLISGLRNSGEREDGNQAAIMRGTMQAIAEAKVRIGLSDKMNDNFIRYDEHNVEIQRRDLDVELATAQRRLYDLMKDAPDEVLKQAGMPRAADNEDPRQSVSRVVATSHMLLHDQLTGDASEKDQAFKSLRNSQAWKMAGRSAASGALIGLAGQEIVAGFSDGVHGIADGLPEGGEINQTTLAKAAEPILNSEVAKDVREFFSDVPKGVDNIIQSTEQFLGTTHKGSFQEFMDSQRTMGNVKQISHDGFMDNDTSSFDENELKMRLSSHVDAQGNAQYSSTISGMESDGSSHGSSSVDAPSEVAKGNVGLIYYPDGGKGGEGFAINYKADGTLDIPDNIRQFLHVTDEGNVRPHTGVLEVARMHANQDGSLSVQALAAVRGSGDMPLQFDIQDTAPPEAPPAPASPELPVLAPYIIPIYSRAGHKPVERNHAEEASVVAKDEEEKAKQTEEEKAGERKPKDNEEPTDPKEEESGKDDHDKDDGHKDGHGHGHADHSPYFEGLWENAQADREEKLANEKRMAQLRELKQQAAAERAEKARDRNGSDNDDLHDEASRQSRTYNNDDSRARPDGRNRGQDGRRQNRPPSTPESGAATDSRPSADDAIDHDTPSADIAPNEGESGINPRTTGKASGTPLKVTQDVRRSLGPDGGDEATGQQPVAEQDQGGEPRAQAARRRGTPAVA